MSAFYEFPVKVLAISIEKVIFPIFPKKGSCRASQELRELVRAFAHTMLIQIVDGDIDCDLEEEAKDLFAQTVLTPVLRQVDLKRLKALVKVAKEVRL